MTYSKSTQINQCIWADGNNFRISDIVIQYYNLPALAIEAQLSIQYFGLFCPSA